MKTKNLISLVLVVVFTATTFAQKTNAEKILGCWVLKKMEFAAAKPDDVNLSAEAMNSYVCFEKDGTFITRLGGQESNVVKGKYHLSADGENISQSRDIDEEGIDEDGEIMVLNDKKLTLKHEYGTMYFEKK